jgi:hypothetical protein
MPEPLETIHRVNSGVGMTLTQLQRAKELLDHYARTGRADVLEARLQVTERLQVLRQLPVSDMDMEEQPASAPPERPAIVGDGHEALTWQQRQAKSDKVKTWLFWLGLAAAFIAWRVIDTVEDESDYTPPPPARWESSVDPADCDVYGPEPLPDTADWDYWRSGFSSDAELSDWRLICDNNFDPRPSWEDGGGWEPVDEYGGCPAGPRSC